MSLAYGQDPAAEPRSRDEKHDWEFDNNVIADIVECGEKGALAKCKRKDSDQAKTEVQHLLDALQVQLFLDARVVRVVDVGLVEPLDEV